MDEATATPAETPQEAPVAPPVPLVVPESTTKLRGDDDALVGEFVKIVDGEHAGRVGAFLEVLSHNPVTGYPMKVLVRTRDAANELLHVLYGHIRPHRTYKGGR